MNVLIPMAGAGSMFKLSTTTCIIGLPFTSIIGFGNVYPACANLEPAPAHEPKLD
jgi:hypothetical protein